MMYAKQHLKWIVYECMMMVLAFNTLIFSSDAQANSENITARDILQRALETVTNRPPMMADGEFHHKWDYSFKGISESKYVSRVYIRGQQHDTTRDTWELEDDKWVKWTEHRSIWDGSRYTLRETIIPLSRIVVIYDDKPLSVEWGMGGGYALTGTSAGNKHFAEWMLKSKTLRLRPEMEQVDGFACYVVEDGRYTVWLDPQNGYLHRKITFEDRDPNITGVTSYGRRIVKVLSKEVTDVKIEVFDGIPMVTEATLRWSHEYTDGERLDAIYHEKMSNVVWNPDFESMGAFKMDKVPDGTRVIYKVDDLHKTGVKFHWQGGRIVPDVDEEAIEQIDRIVEELIAEGQVPDGLKAAKKAEAAPNKASANVDERPGTTEAQREVLSESRALPALLLISIGLLIIAVIAWRVFLLGHQ